MQSLSWLWSNYYYYIQQSPKYMCTREPACGGPSFPTEPLYRSFDPNALGSTAEYLQLHNINLFVGREDRLFWNSRCLMIPISMIGTTKIKAVPAQTSWLPTMMTYPSSVSLLGSFGQVVVPGLLWGSPLVSDETHVTIMENTKDNDKDWLLWWITYTTGY